MTGGEGSAMLPSWRRALAPGEDHGFWEDPGWWDARAMRRTDEDTARLRAELIAALPPIPVDATVADVGAGTGNLILELLRFHPSWHYALIDPNKAALDRARMKIVAAFPEATISSVNEGIDPNADAPLPGGPYHLVTSTIALHDVAPPAAPGDEEGRERHRRSHVALLRRIHASLLPGGHLIYADAMRARFRVIEHLTALIEAGFAEVDAAYVAGRLMVCGGQRT